MSVTRVSSVPAPEVNVGPGNTVAASRSLIYARFADAFRHPADVVAAGRLADGSAERELTRLIDELARRQPAYSTSPLCISARDSNTASPDMDILYCSLFDSAVGAGSVSLLERDHGPLGREELWEDLFRCYAHFGLEFERGGLKEAPDHLTIELEFMHFLTFIEAASPETASGVVLGERDFLARHLAAWAPALCRPIAEQSTGSAYHRIAHRLSDFVSTDRAYLESRTHQPRSSQ